MLLTEHDDGDNDDGGDDGDLEKYDDSWSDQVGWRRGSYRSNKN